VIANATAIANGKGGVGKTTLAANLGGLAATSGWRVLIADLDPQGNLGRDLGYLTAQRSDEGEALFAAVQAYVSGKVDPRGYLLPEHRPTPLRDVRKNLDVLAGGRYTEDLIDILASQTRRNLNAIRALGFVLAPLAADYDLVLFDCPPARGLIQDAALAAAHYLVIPTTFDDGSLDGLTLMAQATQEARQRNPDIQLLGVVLFNFSSAARQLVREVVEEITAGLGEVAPVWRPPVRSAPRAARDTRRRGLLAHEYEAAAMAAKPGRAAGRPVDANLAAELGLFDAGVANGKLKRYSSAAGTLASDYQRITDQLLRSFVEHSQSSHEAGR